jgi:hypothetical protein
MSVIDVATALAVGVGQAVVKPVRPGPGPATERWGVGVGEAVAGLPKVPSLLHGLARQLNRLGSVVVSPGGIEFDGDEVAWGQITEIRTRRLVGYLVTDAITKQVNRVPIWRFPGRGLVLSGVTTAALTAVAVVADLHLDRGVFTLCIPAEVHYRGMLRSKEIQPGVPAALVLADPAVRDFVETTAHAKGVPIRQADNDALEQAVQRAAVIREGIGLIAAVVGIGSQAR